MRPCERMICGFLSRYRAPPFSIFFTSDPASVLLRCIIPGNGLIRLLLTRRVGDSSLSKCHTLCSVPTRSDDRSHHAQPLDELIESLVMIWWLEAFVDSDVLTQFQDESRTLQVLASEMNQ